MNSQFIADLRSKNTMFQKITEHLYKNENIRVLTMPEMMKITGAKKEEIDQLCQSLNDRAGIGRYIHARKGNPNRFEFENYPVDIAMASVDGVHTADPIPKVIRSRTSPVVNDAGKVVPVTDTREKHISISLDEKGFHIDISPGVVIPAETLTAIMAQLN